MRRRKQVVTWPPAIMDKQDEYELVHVCDVDLELAWLERQRQNRIAKLRRLKALWDVEDDDRRRQRAAEIVVVVAADRVWLQRQNEIELEQERGRNWYLTELEKEQRAGDVKRPARLKELTAEINRDIVRAEREELIRRGVYRGR